jgi:hypothetical protein
MILNKKIIVGGEKNIVIPLSNKATSSFSEEDLEVFIEDETEKNIPPIEDFEVDRYSYISGVDGFVFTLFGVDGQIKRLPDYDFTQNDVDVFSSRLAFSFLRMNFYDLPNAMTNKFLFNIDIFFQRINTFSNAPPSPADVKNVNDITLQFRSTNPNLFVNETEGFYYYIRKNYGLDKIYCNFRFNNALNGVSYNFAPKIINPSAFVEEDTFLEINLNKTIKRFNFTGLPVNPSQLNNFLFLKLYSFN